MARKLRVQYQGAIYHVINRGDRRESIFHDDEDRAMFLTTLHEACTKTDWQVHAYCLMPNHFHLVVETPKANLVEGMKWFLGTYTTRFNRRHKVFGHLFGGRYKALIIDGSGTGYLKGVCEYVHLNPVRARLLRPEARLESYTWSSLPSYLLRPAQRPLWLRVHRVFGEMGIPKDSKAGRRHFRGLMEERRLKNDPDEYRKIRRGWYLGDEAFRQQLLEQMSERMGPEHYGEEKQETAERKAESILREELSKRRLSTDRVARLPKGHRAKVEIARRLQNETTMTVGWIARRLQMGSRSYAYRLLYLDRKIRPAKSIV